jgi:hypothetical protein
VEDAGFHCAFDDLDDHPTGKFARA